MKLETETGSIVLPDDFSFEIESNNPFFSDNGTASVPATLPADSRILGMLQHPERCGMARRPVLSVPAILSHDIFQRKCNMIMESCGIDDGVSVSLAFNESEAYSSAKEKQLKDVFSEKKIRFEGIDTIEDLVKAFYERMYMSQSPDLLEDDCLRIFPVAVELEENDGQSSVQIINEVNDAQDGFVYLQRTIHSGSDDVKVPTGYGISPFLLLHRMIDMLFSSLGYMVVRNDFSSLPFSDIVLVNNCSDTICNGPEINMSDLVPTMTVGDFIAWLKDRFGAAVTVCHDEIRIIFIQNALSEPPDLDLSRMMREKPVFSYPAASRVVLSCQTDLDSAAPAADSLAKLREKHLVVREIGPAGDPKSNCLILRRELGKYYSVKSYQNAEKFSETLVGSNCFTYDRENSENSETYSAEDRFVPEIVVGDNKTLDGDGLIMPYIGDRLHYHTIIAGEDEEDEQPLQICYAFWDDLYARPASHWFGSTQPYQRFGWLMQYYDGASAFDYPKLTPDGMYPYCWEAYNGLLLNSAPEIEAQIDFSLPQLLALDMMRPKLLEGQRVMIKSLSYEISRKGVACGKCKLQLIPCYSDAIKDGPVIFETEVFGWKLVDTFLDELNQAVDPGNEDYEILSEDGLTDYTKADAPSYKPTETGIIVMKRSRWMRINIWDARVPEEEAVKVERTLNWEEYFESVYSDTY